MTSQENNEKAPTVAYVPFKTFMAAIQALEKGVPDVIQRTFWPNYTGAMQSQILGALKFLRLVHADGRTTPELKSFVMTGETDRRSLMESFLVRSYKEVLRQDPAKMSLGALDAAMQKYDVTGATLQKAKTFFLQAARFSKMPLSPVILNQTRNVTSRKKRMTNPMIRVWGSDGAKAIPRSTVAGPTKAIALKKGVTLTLQTSADTFQMAPEDRQFVLKLLEQIEAYETQNPTPDKPKDWLDEV